MSENKTSIWKIKTVQQLAKVLADIDNMKTMQNFLGDVMTEKEIIEISSRLQAARMLKDNCTYSAVIKKTKLSSRTVARISDWMQNGYGGYTVVLDQISANHSHISPL